jgi:hypothetical protein
MDRMASLRCSGLPRHTMPTRRIDVAPCLIALSGTLIFYLASPLIHLTTS